MAGSELIVRFVVAPNDGYEHYKASFRNARSPLAAFGDSHVANGLESNGELTNLGWAGDSLHLMLVKARSYAATGHARRIVLQYSPQQFAIYRAAKEQVEVADDLLGRGTPWLHFMQPHFRQYLLAYWETMLNDPGRVFAVHAAEPEDRTTAGEGPRLVSLPVSEQRRLAGIRVQLHAPLPQGRTVEALVERFAQALREIRDRGIDICVVEFPLSTVYRDAAAQAPTFAAMRARMQALLAAEKVRFLDLTAAMPDSAFGDPDHIGRQGRAALTNLVLSGCFGAGTSVPTQ